MTDETPKDDARETAGEVAASARPGRRNGSPKGRSRRSETAQASAGESASVDAAQDEAATANASPATSVSIDGAPDAAPTAGEPDQTTPDGPAATSSPLTTRTDALAPAEGGETGGDDDARAIVLEHLKPIVEALVFASPEPLSLKALQKLLDGEPKEDVAAALAALQVDYQGTRGLQLVEVAGGYQIVTRPELHDWVRRLFHERTTQKLSVPALETLAVIAYRQPITAPEIADVRGVNTSGVLSTLLERKLVKIVGRKQVVGRPFMYATTREFLDKFGLRDLADLPKVEDMADMLGFEPPTGLMDVGGETLLPFDASAGGDSGAEGDPPSLDRASRAPDDGRPGEDTPPEMPDDESGHAIH
ncbi:MAG: SMC-Scp complex subunit ScpB [Vicinamibacterales bacterium]